MVDFYKYDKKNPFSGVFDPMEYLDFVFWPQISSFCKCRILNILKFEFLDKKVRIFFFFTLEHRTAQKYQI